MFERETRREKILEAIDHNREMQLRQKNKVNVLHLLGVGKKTTPSNETDEQTKRLDPLEEAEKEFYKIIKEVKVFHLLSKLNP